LNNDYIAKTDCIISTHIQHEAEKVRQNESEAEQSRRIGSMRPIFRFDARALAPAAAHERQTGSAGTAVFCLHAASPHGAAPKIPHYRLVHVIQRILKIQERQVYPSLPEQFHFPARRQAAEHSRFSQNAPRFGNKIEDGVAFSPGTESAGTALGQVPSDLHCLERTVVVSVGSRHPAHAVLIHPTRIDTAYRAASLKPAG
jgi:hypothetical protein